MRPRRMRRLLALSTFGAVIAGASLGTGIARAEGVCDYLDTHPGVAGVEDLVAASHYALPDSTDYQHGQAIAAIVINECPRHLFTLNAFVAKWGQGGYVA